MHITNIDGLKFDGLGIYYCFCAMTVDVFEVVFHSWTASITIYARIDSFHRKNYNVKERN